MLPRAMPNTRKSIRCVVVYLPPRAVKYVPTTMIRTMRMRNPHKKPVTAHSVNLSPRLVRMPASSSETGIWDGPDKGLAHPVEPNSRSLLRIDLLGVDARIPRGRVGVHDLVDRDDRRAAVAVLSARERASGAREVLREIDGVAQSLTADVQRPIGIHHSHLFNGGEDDVGGVVGVSVEDAQRRSAGLGFVFLEEGFVPSREHAEVGA